MSELKDLFPLGTTLTPDGHLQIAGHELGALAGQWGTPLYVYDALTVRTHIQDLQAWLKQAYPGAAEITYAAKAYFSAGFARKLAAMDIGVDVVSLGEMEVARLGGFQPERVHLHGNNKSEQELCRALELGLHNVVLDSLEEIDFLEEIAGRLGKSMRVWLRLTPGVNIHTHPHIQTGHAASKFGFSIHGGQAAEGIHRLRGSRWLKLTGLHTHLGSQITEPEAYRQAIHSMYALAGQEGFIPQEFSPGGGWGVAYTFEDQPQDGETWIRTVADALAQECSRRDWPLPRLYLEPGRWLAGRAGVALYTAGTGKVLEDGTYIVAVDGGMADNPRPALYQARYQAFVVDRPQAPASRRTSLVGKFCESGDKLIPETFLPPVQRGDVLALPVAGAYQLSMASNYNLAARPTVLWLDAGQVEVLQKQERPEISGWWVDV
ncbi:MAG: diaminopimelate decarboxylase [Chloroflexi bacterium]|nr:diaminopimelate decarboxylase [Chloroflexota bacterium]